MSLVALVKHVETRIPQAVIQSYGRLAVRLYGGWDIDGSLTRVAQLLAAEIQRGFPAPLARTEANGKVVSRLTTVELATHGLAAPSLILRRTYVRDRTVPRTRCKSRPWTKCSSPGLCALSDMENFFLGSTCPTAGCVVTPSDVLRRDEQKQVDTLIVADLCELSLRHGAKHVVLVSSDADMWPGVLACLSSGSSVVQINTTPGMSTPRHLKSNLGRMASQYIDEAV